MNRLHPFALALLLAFPFAALAQSTRDRAERTLWTIWLPTLFAVAAVLVALAAARPINKTDEGKRRQHGESPQRDEIGVA